MHFHPRGPTDHLNIVLYEQSSIFNNLEVTRDGESNSTLGQQVEAPKAVKLEPNIELKFEEREGFRTVLEAMRLTACWTRCVIRAATRKISS
jgi:hypothetical protein